MSVQFKVSATNQENGVFVYASAKVNEKFNLAAMDENSLIGCRYLIIYQNRKRYLFFSIDD